MVFSKQDTVAVAGSETSQSEVSPELFTYNPLNRMKSTSRRARKRKRSSSVRNQLIATQQRNEIANHSDARRSSDAVVKDMKQLSLYLEAAEEAKQAMQSMADPQSSNVGTPMADLVVVTKWHSAVKVYFKRSSLSFSSLIRSEKMNMDMASAFSEATALAVSLITTSSTSEGRKFSRSWICGAVVILNDVHKQAKESRFTEVLVPVYHSICALLQYCNKRFPNWPRDTMDFVRHVEATESEDISVDRLESVITDLAEHFSRDCVYCLMIHETGNTALWNDIQWETLIQAGWFLANWIELALECSNLQPNWLNAIQGTLNVVERAFPGRLPQLLLELCNVKRISMFTDQTDAQDGVVSSSADALPGNDTASDSLKGDIGRPISKLKRVKLSKDLPTDIQEQTKALFCTAKELSQNFEAREEIESFTKEIGKIQRFLGSALLVNKMLIVSLRLGHPDIASDFAGATAILTDLICRCPSASLEYHQLKGLLRQYISILQMCRNKTGEPIDTLSKSVEKLQWYWDKFVADPFQTMRNHVEATERLSEELTPQLLEYPMRQLLCQYRNACIFSEDMFAQSLISIQVRQCRAGLMEIGLMLNRWVQHTLEAGAQIQKPPGLPKLLAQLINIEVKVPGSIPEPLVE
ncbi:hypothetical protein PHMEG_0001058 [Phytophthora megakarya]|uniref:Uncharacterized protein n=1 Tax=Phytophthora megakarya TaxID=4795 RepID=A0A225X2L8_9STRA|nr:hypothetical protein PHMEG_0001058 [Phytophthora megakarya]